MSLCNICEAPAVMHIGAGPRCGIHQYHPGPTLAELAAELARTQSVIAQRFTEQMKSRDAVKRNSLPPVLVINTPAREQARQHFLETQRILAGIK